MASRGNDTRQRPMASSGLLWAQQITERYLYL